MAKQAKTNARVVWTHEYAIDADALRRYARTEAAQRVSKRSGMTHKRMIEMLLKTVDEGMCKVEYKHDEVADALLDARHITHARMFPVDYLSCVFQLPGRQVPVRALALHENYFEVDDSKCFHRIIVGTSSNTDARDVAMRIIREGDTVYQEIAKMYNLTPDQIKDAFHAFSNGKQIMNWKRDVGRVDQPTHPFIEQYVAAQSDLTEELARANADAVKLIQDKFPTKRDEKGKEIPRDPKMAWKFFYCAQFEARSLEIKMRMCRERGIPIGPPMHDGLAVAKRTTSGDIVNPELLAHNMSVEISKELGFEMIVKAKMMTPPVIRENWCFDRTHYSEGAEDKDALAWLQRHFACITGQKSDIVVELKYTPSTNRIATAIVRSSSETLRVHRGIYRPPTGKQKTGTPLLEWYLANLQRREHHAIGMYTTPAMAAAHPHNLNTFGGLPFDVRFEEEGLRKGSGPRFEVAASEEEPAWRELDDFDFILWHLRYNLCGGDREAFAYTIQVFFWHFQHRVKPGVLVAFFGPQGTGKSALFGRNAVGPGLLWRCYNEYAQKYSDADSMLHDFNADAMGKMYCCLEEVRAGNGARNTDKMKDMITEGSLRVIPKGVDAFHVPDHRLFVAMTQKEDAFPVERGDRRYMLNRGRKDYSQLEVDRGNLPEEEYKAFCTRLNRVAHSDEVAYAFFRLGMLADLSTFNVHAPVLTECKRERQQAGGCRIEHFLEDVASGEHEIFGDFLPTEDGGDGEGDGVTAWLTLAKFYEQFCQWHRMRYRNGAWIDPANALAFAKGLRVYQDVLLQIKPGRNVKYAVMLRDGVDGEP